MKAISWKKEKYETKENENKKEKIREREYCRLFLHMSVFSSSKSVYK